MRSDETITAWTFPFCPTPPDFQLDWPGLTAQFAWLRALAGCPQDPVFHGEGDVLSHTRLVVESLIANGEWRRLDQAARAVLFAAALLHDVAKPVCTRRQNGRLVSPNHARRGAQLAQEILYREFSEAGLPVPFTRRQQIVGLVRHHGLPLWFWDKAEMQRAVLSASYQARLDWAAMLAQADVEGRICADQADLRMRLALFREYAGEMGCWERPFAFVSDHARFVYFTRRSDQPDYVPYDDTLCEVTLLAGLPGSGKDTWLRQAALSLPVVALDDLRAELRISPTDNQGAVIAAAREQARLYLRQGQGFVWNATNITRPLRQQLIGLFDGYKARVRVVYLEAPWPELVGRNQKRAEAVPEAVLLNLAAKLDAPDLTEAQQVTYVAAG
ncbi:MAG: ATP-binding protein [Chloroflexota bacterium]